MIEGQPPAGGLGATIEAKMPRLSEQLTCEETPAACQACGSKENLERWQEHSDKDLPERIIVVLCEPCAAKLVEQHPRLYRRMEAFRPWPGAMTICVDCVHRRGTACGHKDAKDNGGPGVMLHMPRPFTGFVDYGGKDKHKSGSFCQWRGPVTSCKQKEMK